MWMWNCVNTLGFGLAAFLIELDLAICIFHIPSLPFFAYSFPVFHNFSTLLLCILYDFGFLLPGFPFPAWEFHNVAGWWLNWSRLPNQPEKWMRRGKKWIRNSRKLRNFWIYYYSNMGECCNILRSLLHLTSLSVKFQNTDFLYILILINFGAAVKYLYFCWP